MFAAHIRSQVRSIIKLNLPSCLSNNLHAFIGLLLRERTKMFAWSKLEYKHMNKEKQYCNLLSKF